MPASQGGQFIDRKLGNKLVHQFRVLGHVFKGDRDFCGGFEDIVGSCKRLSRADFYLFKGDVSIFGKAAIWDSMVSVASPLGRITVKVPDPQVVIGVSRDGRVLEGDPLVEAG